MVSLTSVFMVDSRLWILWGFLSCLACGVFAMHRGAWVSQLFGYACCGLDFPVCCHPRLPVSQHGELLGSRLRVLGSSMPRHRRSGPCGLRCILVLWFCFWRIGEAAVPGPSPSWSLGVFNPSGLAHKSHLINSEVDCWAVCETHLSRPAFRQLLACLQRDGSSYKWCLQGEPVPCRSTVSSVGAWSGVAFMSQWPTRALPGGWSPALQASSRLLCTTSFVHNLWLSGITVYGTPTGPTHPHARDTTNGLLRAAAVRIAQSHGPRFVAGDWNHDLGVLESVNDLLALGFKDVQDLHYERTGICPKPTCKNKTRRDFLFISPELQIIFEACSVDSLAWPDHASVVAHFHGGQNDLVQFPWQGRDDGKFVDFSSTEDVTASYTSLWEDVEACAQSHAIRNGRPLSNHFLGRGARFQPNTVVVRSPPVPCGRKGDCQPTYFGSSWQHARLFRQVRRLQSYARLVGQNHQSVNHREHRASLWRAILQAPGFQPSFSQWWIDHDCLWTSLPELPSSPPEHACSVCIFEAVRVFVEQFEKDLNRHRAYVAKLCRGHDMKHVYAAVRRDPPAPVDFLLHHRSGEVESVLPDESAIEFKHPVEWDELTPFVHRGMPMEVIVSTDDKLWLEHVDQIHPGDTVVQHAGTGRLEDVFEAFITQWSIRWAKHDLIPDSQWDQVVGFAHQHLRPVVAPEVSWDVPLLKSTVHHKKVRSACGLDGVTRADLLALRPCHHHSILSLFHRVECDGSWPWPVQPLDGVVKSLAKVPCPMGTNDYRPITILGMLYRTWSSVHARHWLKHLDEALDPFVMGNRTGCRSSHVWRYMLDQVEWSQLSDGHVSGLTLDLSKAFNTLPRFPTFAAAKIMGVRHSTLVGWAGALSQLSRRFMVRGSVSRQVFSSCGFPEGCALSCVAMIIIDNVFHSWMQAGNFRCTPVSYVDNWEIVLAQPDLVRGALDRALTFASQ